jgi:hypothetical protein
MCFSVISPLLHPWREGQGSCPSPASPPFSRSQTPGYRYAGAWASVSFGGRSVKGQGKDEIPSAPAPMNPPTAAVVTRKWSWWRRAATRRRARIANHRGRADDATEKLSTGATKARQPRRPGQCPRSNYRSSAPRRAISAAGTARVGRRTPWRRAQLQGRPCRFDSTRADATMTVTPARDVDPTGQGFSPASAPSPHAKSPDGSERGQQANP